jgi:2-aminoadipate transaminase
VTADNVVITHGAQQALELIGRIFLNRGDRVIVEEPTYLALLSSWRSHGAEFLTAHGDSHGIRIDLLRQQLQHDPRLLYVVPNFQNPQGTTLDEQRRIELLLACREHEVGVIEDDPYGHLRFDDENPRSLLALDGTHNEAQDSPLNVVRIGTFSKILAPGFRVGWAIAPGSVADKLVQAKQTADLHTATLTQLVACELIENGTVDHQIPRLCDEYRSRRDAMLSALQRHMPPGCAWTRPAGGMFLWVTLPMGMDATALLPQALEQKVAYVPGETFHLNRRGQNTLRLNFSNATPTSIEEGIRRLGTLFSNGRT